MAPRGEGHPPGRPWVVVNCAMSADGKLALPSRRAVELSSEEDLLRVHTLRAGCDAILVGVGTVVADDPKLYVSPKRVPDPPAPLKVVLDSGGRTPGGAAFLDGPGDALVATVGPALAPLEARLGEGAEVRAFGDGPRVHLSSLLEHLAGQGVRRLLVEGGGETIWSFFEAGLVDELSVYLAPLVIGGSDAPTPADGGGASDLASTVQLATEHVERLGDGVWIRYRVVGRS